MPRTRPVVEAISTERLVLRPPHATEGSAVLRLLSSLPSAAIEDAMPSIAPHRHWALVVRALRKTTPKIVLLVIVRKRYPSPLIGLAMLAAVHECQAKLGLALAPRFQGRGYGQEALQALVHYGWKSGEYTTLIGECTVSNRPAQALMRRAGMTLRYRLKMEMPDGSPRVILGFVMERQSPIHPSQETS
jgi:RimJ/RimL family protein N-acetyltransferase